MTKRKGIETMRCAGFNTGERDPLRIGSLRYLLLDPLFFDARLEVNLQFMARFCYYDSAFALDICLLANSIVGRPEPRRRP
jgi:hypothetical protein